MTEGELFAVLDDLARKVLALARAGRCSAAWSDTPEVRAVDALEKAYPAEYARWTARARA